MSITFVPFFCWRTCVKQPDVIIVIWVENIDNGPTIYTYTIEDEYFCNIERNHYCYPLSLNVIGSSVIALYYC